MRVQNVFYSVHGGTVMFSDDSSASAGYQSSKRPGTTIQVDGKSV